MFNYTLSSSSLADPKIYVGGTPHGFLYEDSNSPDWNPWDDDCVISNVEISMAEWYWVTNTPINKHVISNAEISMLEYQWVTDDVCQEIN